MTLRTLCCYSLLILAATACQAKPLPEPPFTVEQMEAFADPVDLAVLYGLNINKGESKKSVHYATAFLQRYEPYPLKRGLITVNDPGVVLTEVVETDRNQTTERRRRMKLFNFPTWDQNGHLINVKSEPATPNDLALINRLTEVHSLHLEGYADTDHIDLSLLSARLPLWTATFYRTKLTHPQHLCEYPKLQYLEITGARVIGDMDFSGCFKPMVDLVMSSADIDALTIRNLPELVYLHLGDSRFKQLHIDGASLPKLQSLTLSQADIPADVDSIKLPEGLTQLYLENVSDDDISRLKLPKSLQYLNLRGTQLKDYGFIKGAPHLIALNLWGSNFNQWELLSSLQELKYLNAIDTSIHDIDLQQIAQLTQLVYLSLSQTNITNAQPLEALTHLWLLNLYETNLNDLNNVPYIPDISYLALPSTEYYRHPEKLPTPIQKMLETTKLSSQECNNLKPCEQPPWNFDTP